MGEYNLSAISQNSTDVPGFLQAVDGVLLSGWLGALLLLGITTVFAIAYFQATQDFGKTLATSTYVATILAVFLAALGILAPLFLYICMVTAAASTAFLWKKD